MKSCKEPNQPPAPTPLARHGSSRTIGQEMQSTARDVKVLMPARNAGICMLVVGLVLAAGGGWRMQEPGRFSLPHLVMVFGILVTAAAVEHFLSGIRLYPDRLEYGNPFWKKSIRKEEIESVTWEAGCGVSLRMKSQTWRKIPDLGRAQGVCHSIRAWLKK
jgi:hypothetical protein